MSLTQFVTQRHRETHQPRTMQTFQFNLRALATALAAFIELVVADLSAFARAAQAVVTFAPFADAHRQVERLDSS